MSFAMQFKPFVLMLSFSFITMIGCTTQASSHQMGPTLNDEDIAKLTPDTTKQEVIDQYGQPSFRCFTPGNHNLCYFHQTKKNDKVTDRRQVEIEFDENGRIKEVKIYEPVESANAKAKTDSKASGAEPQPKTP